MRREEERVEDKGHKSYWNLEEHGLEDVEIHLRQ